MIRNSEFPSDKAALRDWARHRRFEIDLAQVSVAVCRVIAGLPEFVTASRVLLYLATPSEINVENLTGMCGSPPKRWFVPRCAPERRLAIHEYNPGHTRLPTGPFGIREPDPSVSSEFEAEQIDLVIVPGLLFTRLGGRLGHGGGYYDRLLPRLSPSCVSVGVTSEAQLVSRLPGDPWDMTVDIVVTEAGAFRATASRVI